MADRAKYPSQSFGIGREYAEMQFTLGGTGVPVVTEGKELVASTAHSAGTNVCTITMKDSWPKVVAHAVDVRDDTPNGAYATIGTITNEGGGQGKPLIFNINTWTAGGAAANNSTLVVSVTLALRNSSIPAGSGN